MRSKYSIGAGAFFVMLPVFFIVFFFCIYMVSPLADVEDTDSYYTLLSKEYTSLYEKITDAEKDGIVTYLHKGESNFQDTVLVYLSCYAKAGMSDSEKRNAVQEAFQAMNVIKEENKETEITAGTSLGKFKVTAYCGCRECNGKWYGQPTASGTDYEEGRTIAVDPDVIPLGTKVVMEGNVYTAEDTGSAIVGNTIDLYIEDHDRCNEWGVQYKEVYLADGEENSLKMKTKILTYENYTVNDYIKSHSLSKEQKELLDLFLEEEILAYIGNGGDKSTAIAYAKAQVGVPYSQDLEKRMTTHFDCSSLIYRSYEKMGIILPLTAAEQAKYLEEKGLAVNENELKAGDLIFYSYTKNGRYKDISHVGMYLGNQQMIEASSSKDAVVIGTFRRSNINTYCRPE